MHTKTKVEAYEMIAQQLPGLIFVSGKTATGKSTFAQKLKQGLHYQVIELDSVLLESVVQPLGLTDVGTVFVEVYRNRNQMDWVKRFVAATISEIERFIKDGEKVILEGALANPDTLKEIISSFADFSFIYFHPEHLDVYIAYLASRFMRSGIGDSAGLPKAFWTMVNDTEFAEFCQTRTISRTLHAAIASFAAQSRLESEVRLTTFLEAFPNIQVVVS